MAGFDSQADAEAAFLSNYNDPRFLGPVTAMPVDEFVQKVRATKEKPAMIKSQSPVVLFFKSHVGPYLRGGKIVNVAGYQGKGARVMPQPGQMSLFGTNKPLPPSPLAGAHPVKNTPDLFGGQEDAPEQKPHEALSAALKRKDLAAAMSILNPLGKDDAAEALLRAGFALSRSKTKAELLADVQSQLLRAAKSGTDGHGLRSDTVTEPRADLIAEHERLVGVLESPSHADDKVEAKRQAKELGDMKGEGGDVVDPFTLSKNELNKRLDAMVAAGEAYDSIRAFLELRKRYVRATGKPSIPPMGSRAIRINPEDLTG
jgi:hypothetical protein